MRTIVLFLLFINVFNSNAQEADHPEIMDTDTSWTKECFAFPLSFAPSINFEGYEEALFPPGWSNSDSSTFWSYVFTWRINSTNLLSDSQLEEHLQTYFDGLMRVQRDGFDPTIVDLDSLGEEFNFSGMVKTTDAFFSKETMLLNVIIHQQLCTDLEQLNIVFRFSPKHIEHSVWETLYGPTLPQNFCSH